jgi:putative membrane protein
MWFGLGIVAYAVVHPVAQVGWTTWTIHWSTVIELSALGAAYVWGARHLRERAVAAGIEPPVLRRGQQVAFFSGLLVIFLSLNGPLHDLSDTYLFSAHMVQHLLLSLAVPPLLLAGTPGWMLRPFLSNPKVAAIARAVTRPTRCFIIFNVVIAVWHLPPLYNTAIAYHPIHIVQHLTFMVASVLMCGPS